MSHMLLKADARRIPIAGGTVQCVVTSPPYFGLRDYGDSRQIGLEPTPAEFVDAMVGVFREVWRVLRSDGVVFLNIGDSYNGGGVGGGPRGGSLDGASNRDRQGEGRMTLKVAGLKAKDRIGIPHRLVFALQDDGWYFRDEIVWHKPAPMPESVTDRCTKAHEFVFMLTKHERYFFDQEAIKEAFADERKGASGAKSLPYSEGSGRRDTLSDGSRPGLGITPSSDGRNPRSVWTINGSPMRLRSDLSPEARNHVVGELLRRGLL